jgi:CxxC-x17-CxxC domain-containing protein
MPNTEFEANPVTLFAQTNFRNQQRRFGIKLDDRRRHMYILGKTGMGKTALLENMILSDIYAGHGCAYIDPHGDTAEKLIDFIPSWRINDVVYFNPADVDFPMGFNILETLNDGQKHLVGSGLMGVFKKIWPDVWSARMEYILLNCVLALLDFPGATLLGINRLLVDKEYRQRVIEKIRDPIVKTFWVAEFSSWSEKYATEAIAPVQNKVGQFLSASIIRNIAAQVKSSIIPRRIMDEQKIFIVNLSKGRIGEDNMRLLGGMLITKIQLAAMERVDTPEEERKDFFCYVDEFQNFANPSFASILSEARKYRLSLTLAHQYIEQLDETVRDAVFGNVGTMIMMRVGAPDAAFLETEFTPTFLPEDLTNLPKYHIYLKLMVDGVSTEPFSATTLPPIANRTDSAEKVIAVSRERYGERRDVIEQKVLKWSGMESGSTDSPVMIEPSGPITEVEPPPGFQYPAIQTEEERDAAEATKGDLDERAAPQSEYLRFSPERLAAIVKAGPAPKKDKPKFKHTCSRCGKVWEMPIQLDPTRPMYCSDCLPLIRDEKKIKGKVIKAAVTGEAPEGMTFEEMASDDREAESTPGGQLEQAMRDVEDGRAIRIAKKQKSPETNRPRIIVTNADMYSDVIAGDDGDEERSELLDAISERRGAPIETRKQAAVPTRDVRPPIPPRPSRAGDFDGHRGDDRDDARPRRPSGRRPRERTANGRGFGGGLERPDGHRSPSGDRNALQTHRGERPPFRPAAPRDDRALHHPTADEMRAPDVRREGSRAEMPPPAPRAPQPHAEHPRVPQDPGREPDDDGPIGGAPQVAFKPPQGTGGGSSGQGRNVRPGERIKF